MCFTGVFVLCVLQFGFEIFHTPKIIKFPFFQKVCSRTKTAAEPPICHASVPKARSSTPTDSLASRTSNHPLRPEAWRGRANFNNYDSLIPLFH